MAKLITSLSSAVCAVMAMATLASPTAAAPLTGHEFSIRYQPSTGNQPFFPSLNATADDLNPEIVAGDGFLFDGGDFIDIGADYIRIESDGLGQALNNTLSVEIFILGGAGFLTSSPGTQTSSFPSSAPGFGQVLTVGVLISNVDWDAGGFFEISGLEVSFPSDVPAPGAMALLGFGLIGLAAARRKSR